jgi:energy-coupling factor transporter transmembrane protein EcfT
MSTPAPPPPIPADDPERTKSPKRSMAAAVLSLEAIVLGLTTPVLISISSVTTGTALAVGLGLCVVCVVLAGMLRHRWAYAVGWAVQLAAILLGFVIGMMFVLGAIFAILWWGAVALGNKIERERAAAFAEYDRLQANG